MYNYLHNHLNCYIDILQLLLTKSRIHGYLHKQNPLSKILNNQIRHKVV